MLALDTEWDEGSGLHAVSPTSCLCCVGPIDEASTQKCAGTRTDTPDQMARWIMTTNWLEWDRHVARDVRQNDLIW